MTQREPWVSNSFDAAAARKRCLGYRRRILDLSQRVSALHVGGAFSCLEMVDLVYNGLMRSELMAERQAGTFLMSKGHGCIAQYVVLEDLGILPPGELDRYCTADGILGAHPDCGNPGIEASTGSLGHGMSIATGMAQADRIDGVDRNVYIVLSDGEFQEGSTWEAMMMAANLRLDRLVAFLDLNDFQSFGRTSTLHPHFYPILEKVLAWGWEAAEVNGHDAAAMARALGERRGDAPFLLIGHTVKGRGVEYMENVPLWHYRSPNPAEYKQAVRNLAEISS